MTAVAISVNQESLLYDDGETLQLAGAVLGLPWRLAPEQEPQWWELALREGCLLLLAARVGEGAVTCTPAFDQRLQRHARQLAAREMLVAERIQEVLAALSAAGIPVLLMKGSALAYALYSRPEWRMRVDTDLLVPDKAAADRAWTILADMGYHRPAAFEGDLVSRQFMCHGDDGAGGQVTLDVHWALNNIEMFAAAARFDELWQCRVALPLLGENSFGLGKVYALILACGHRLGHAAEGNANRLIWLYDIHLLAQSMDSGEWESVTALARERHQCAALLDGLRVATRYFDTVYPENIISTLADGAAREFLKPAEAGNRLKMEWWNFRSLLGVGAKLRFLCQHLFPPVAYIREKYRYRGILLLPWFYARRIVGGVVKLFGRVGGRLG